MDAVSAARLLILALIYAGPGLRDSISDKPDDQENIMASLLNENIEHVDAETNQEDEVVRALLHNLLVSKRARNPAIYGDTAPNAPNNPSRVRHAELIRRFPFKSDMAQQACQYTGTCEIGWKRSVRKRRSARPTNINQSPDASPLVRHRQPSRLQKLMRPMK